MVKLRELLPQVPAVFEKQHQLNTLTGLLSDQVLKAGERSSIPSIGLSQAVVNAWFRQQMAYRQQMMQDLMTIALTIEEIRSPINRIVSEVFRKGITWAPKFAMKCEKCATEFSDVVEECEKCRTPEHLRAPDPDQKERPDLFLNDANIWDQSVEEVCKQAHFDINALDDLFIYLAKEYWADDGDDTIRSRIIEIRRLDPALVEFDLDEQGLPKNAHFICYMHREVDFQVPGDCEECGRPLVPAMYKYWNRGQMLYLTDAEVIHASKFNPSETFGWSPILTIFEKAMSIRGMDSFLYRYFFERKMPASMIMVFTDNPESLKRERENIAAKTRMDPNYVPMVAVSSKGNRGRVDLVRMFHTLQEMDYLPVRNEIRERIAAMWGVTPAWQGAPEAFGGLSTQTQQLVVMSRVVESDQRLFESKIFPLILEAFGVTDWAWELPQPEEKAEATRISFAQQRISAANMLFQMGFDIEVSSEEPGIDNVDFKVSGEPQRPEDMYGGMGGMFGGPMGGDEGGEEDDEQAIQFMQKAKGWMGQIQDAGYSLPLIKQVSDSGDAIWFEYNGMPYIAKFVDGSLVDVEKTKYVSYHRHDGHPPHPKNMVHPKALKPEMARESRPEHDIYDAEEPDEDDFVLMDNE
mgnify:CR=1 FL=1